MTRGNDSMASVIFHIDINAFYASAHLIENPELRGKPVVVCSNHRASVITTASYEARKYGIHSAMPLAHAKKLCDDLIVIDVDFSLYQELSRQFIAIIAKYSQTIQQASIDECYVDMSDTIKKYEKPLDLAVAIQKDVEEELLLPTSIGIAPNRFLAKMASDMHKPRGITVLRIREVQDKLWPLPIEAMHGVGRKTVPLLKAKGIHTIGDLAQAQERDVQPILGINTQTYIGHAQGKGSAKIITESEAKSIGQSRTFANVLVDIPTIKDAIFAEVKEVSRRLIRYGYVGRTLTFAVRLDDYKTASRSVTAQNYFEDANAIFERVMALYDEFEGEGAVSFISVSVSNLVDKDEVVKQMSIFEDMTEKSVDDIINRLNQEFKGTVFRKTKELLETDHE